MELIPLFSLDAGTLATATITTAKPIPGEEAVKLAGMIDGRTRLFAVLGDPVQQVMASGLMNRLLAERGANAVLVPVEVSAADLARVVAGLKCIGNLDGILVTVPHKLAIRDHLDRLSEAAMLAGSVTALRREADGSWSGDNFDGEGFVRGLARRGHRVAGKRLALVGAGGAGVSIAAAVLHSGASELSIVDLDRERASALARRLDERWPGLVTVTGTADRSSDILINATPIGLQAADPLPFGLDGVRADAVIADIIMQPAETRLLRQAAARGIAVHSGIHMLIEQIPLYREFFRIP